MRTIVRLGLVIVSLSAPWSLQGNAASIAHSTPARSLGKRLVSSTFTVGSKLWRSIGAEKLIAASLCSSIPYVVCEYKEMEYYHQGKLAENWRWQRRKNTCITGALVALGAAFPKFMLDHQQETVFKPLYKFFIQKPFARGAQLKDRVTPLLVVASPLLYILAKKAYRSCRSYLKRKNNDEQPAQRPGFSIPPYCRGLSPEPSNLQPDSNNNSNDRGGE